LPSRPEPHGGYPKNGQNSKGTPNAPTSGYSAVFHIPNFESAEYAQQKVSKPGFLRPSHAERLESCLLIKSWVFTINLAVWMIVEGEGITAWFVGFCFFGLGLVVALGPQFWPAASLSETHAERDFRSAATLFPAAGRLDWEFCLSGVFRVGQVRANEQEGLFFRAPWFEAAESFLPEQFTGKTPQAIGGT